MNDDRLEAMARWLDDAISEREKREANRNTAFLNGYLDIEALKKCKEWLDWVRDV